MNFISILLFIIFVPLCFFTSFFYNKKDKFFKRFFKSFLHAFCIGIISLLSYAALDDIHYNMEDKFGYFSYPEKFFEFLSNVSLAIYAIIYNFAVLIAFIIEKKNSLNNGSKFDNKK